MILTVEKNIAELVTRLEQIARRNRDVFAYKIDITPKRNGSVMYRFEATEKADGHTFTDGAGETLEQAVADAANGVDDALEQWGYKP